MCPTLSCVSLSCLCPQSSSGSSSLLLDYPNRLAGPVAHDALDGPGTDDRPQLILIIHYPVVGVQAPASQVLDHPLEVAVGQDDDEDEPVVEGRFLPRLDKFHAHVVTGHVGESRDLVVVNLDEGQEAHQVECQVLHGGITRDELRDARIQSVHL